MAKRPYDDHRDHEKVANHQDMKGDHNGNHNQDGDDAGGGNGLKQFLTNFSDELQPFLNTDNLYFANIGTLNNSGVTGAALLSVDQGDLSDPGDDVLNVLIAATGLDPNGPHPIHIHGFEDGDPDSRVPGRDDDADHDHFVEVAEGLHDYGPVLLSLKNNGAFPAGEDSFVFFEQYALPSPKLGDPPSNDQGLVVNEALPLDLREIVIHGLTLDDRTGLGGTNENSIPPNEADGTPSYKAVLPVAAGTIEGAHGMSAFAHFKNALADADLL